MCPFCINNIDYIILMRKKYIIQIADGQAYPFDGAKVSCQDVYVRVKLNCPEPIEYQAMYSKIELMMALRQPCMVQVVKVVEIKNRGYQIDYEYVGSPLRNCEKLNDPSFLHLVREHLQAATQILIDNNIKYELKLQDIGLHQSGMLKIFLGHNFSIVSASEAKDLSSEYYGQIDRILEIGCCVNDLVKVTSEQTYLSDYSMKLDRKLNQIEDKLRMRGHRNSCSSKDSQGNQKNGKEMRHSNMVRESITSRQMTNSTSSESKTTNSFIGSTKISCPKIHKSSFGDYSTTSYRLNQSKQDSLTKRVSHALEKTKKAVRIYEQYFRKMKM